MQGPVIRIVIPAVTVAEAVAVRDRIRGLILQDDDRASIVDGGVAVSTRDPLRVVRELAEDGFF
jgi:hypothetical protein